LVTQDLRTPVLVGCAQLTQRIDDPTQAKEPLALMVEAAEAAAVDAGAPSLLGALDAIRVTQGLWKYENPAAWLGEHFCASGVNTGLGPISGSTVQLMLHRAANDIAAGTRDVVLLVGGEAERSRRRAKAQEVELAWTEVAGGEPDESFAENAPGFGWWETEHRARPVQAFSMFENAIRHQRGEALDAHRARIAELWAGFAQVAANNPKAWIQDGFDAARIATPSDTNAMVAYPYTKYLVANMVVDQSAALVLCSLEAARRHGVREERLVYLNAGTDIAKTCSVPERLAYHDQPGIGLAGRRALELAGCSPEDIGHVDLYSCFPSAVQIAAAEIGFDLARELTVTGGLTFAGGPFNSYVMHSLATMMDRLRADRGSLGFVSAVGGYMAKHAFSVLGTSPGERGYRHECLDEASMALPTRECVREYKGPAVVETFSVSPANSLREGSLLAACRTPGAARFWATSTDAELIASVEREELCGRPVEIDASGVLDVRG
jgi:acetyl-CoA C-acetyltransferase